MIALIVALLCVRLILVALGAVLNILLAIFGLVVEFALLVIRWVLWPAFGAIVGALRGCMADQRRRAYSSTRRPSASSAAREIRALTRQGAVLVGVRVASLR